VGHHGHAAGGGERVRASLERAGLDAQRAFDDAGAVVHYRRAWELARWEVLAGEAEAEEAMARVGVLLGEALRYSGDLTAAEGVLRETLAGCSNQPAQAASAWKALAQVAAAGGRDPERARDHIRTALSHALRGSDRGLVADIYLDLGSFLQRDGDLVAATTELLEGLLIVTGGEGAGSADGPPNTWRLVTRLVELHLARVLLKDAERYAGCAIFQAERVGSPVGQARTHALMGEVLAAAGRPQEATRYRVRAVEFMRNLGDRRSTAELLFALASGDLATGAAEQARARLLEVRELAQALEWNDGVKLSGQTLATIH
jgi:tetratricopeptide (TPR) repeat protein